VQVADRLDAVKPGQERQVREGADEIGGGDDGDIACDVRYPFRIRLSLDSENKRFTL
jgi:hypothetical protein